MFQFRRRLALAAVPAGLAACLPAVAALLISTVPARADSAPPPPPASIESAGAAAGTASADLPQLRIEQARTRVGLANVVLRVEDVELLGDRIRGRYELRIPLAPMMNDRGTLEIQLPATEAATIGPQAVAPAAVNAMETTLVALRRAIVDRLPLTGRGDSMEDGRRHGIRCSMTPEGLIDIVVDTGDRILSFRTNYTLTR